MCRRNHPHNCTATQFPPFSAAMSHLSFAAAKRDDDAGGVGGTGHAQTVFGRNHATKLLSPPNQHEAREVRVLRMSMQRGA